MISGASEIKTFKTTTNAIQQEVGKTRAKPPPAPVRDLHERVEVPAGAREAGDLLVVRGRRLAAVVVHGDLGGRGRFRREKGESQTLRAQGI